MMINDPAQTALKRFLAQQIEQKTEKLQKQLSQAQANGNLTAVAESQTKIDKIKQKYSPEIWLDVEVNTMAKQLKFGTHISRGIHPKAKGDNVNFIPQYQREISLIGTHNLSNPALDANGNAAALPLASFFDFDVSDGIKVRDLILSNHSAFIASLADDETLAKSYHEQLKQALQNSMQQPTAHERNKQVLWAVNEQTAESLADLNYITLIPLYPSALTYDVYLKINQRRYADENKKALENRFKPNAEQMPYITMPNLATVQLGGSKPQNISQLMSRQGGRNYLLPSLPPKISGKQSFNLSKFIDNFFHAPALKYHVQPSFDLIVQVVQDARNNVDIREQRKDAIHQILHTIFEIAQSLQQRPVGWSREYNLSLEQKLWLDPYRADLEHEIAFAEQKAKNEWQQVIMDDFASWLNQALKMHFEHMKFSFADAEYYAWQHEIKEMKSIYERSAQGVFI